MALWLLFTVGANSQDAGSEEKFHINPAQRKLPMGLTDCDNFFTRQDLIAPEDRSKPCPRLGGTVVFQELVANGYTPSDILTERLDERRVSHSILMVPPEFSLNPTSVRPYYSCFIDVDFSDADATTFNMCKKLF